MKIKKLTIAEDLVPQLDDNTDVTVFTNIISGLIKDEWEAIDGYNGAIISLSSMNREDAITIMKDIISEEYIHIGQLEKLLQNVIPISNDMEKGATEAEEQIEDASESTESENEHEELELRVEEEQVEEPVEESIKEDKECFKLIKSKQVVDSDGFMTDYSMYKVDDKYVMIFGDSDIYDPSNTEPDWESESEAEAETWFENYKGFEGEEDYPDDDIPMDIAESVTFKKKDVES